MCLAIPMRITELDGATARVEAGGLSYAANVSLLPGIAAGDYVLVHAGFAIQKLDREDAEERLRLFALWAGEDGETAEAGTWTDNAGGGDAKA
jgi:hydrogenase expression/formation protein HypC